MAEYKLFCLFPQTRKAFIARGGHATPSRQTVRLPTTAEKLGIERCQLVFIG